MQEVISTHGLTRRFGEKTAVDNLNLTVYAGEVFGMLGHNGAGKTTTVRMLNGVLAPSAGRATVLGLEPTTDGKTLRARTGVATETPSLDDRLSARESLEIFADLYNVPPQRVRARVGEVLELFNLTDAADLKVGGYSKGMRQRLALARVLLHDPELFFLDEPTSGLDPVASRNVNLLIRELTGRGKTVFLCTHNLVEAQSLCDRVAVLEHGRLVALGTPQELAQRAGGGQKLELILDPQSVAAALNVLKDCFNLDATQNGERLTLELPHRDSTPDLIAALAKAGVRLYGVTPQAPSLEDVYFNLHKGAIR